MSGQVFANESAAGANGPGGEPASSQPRRRRLSFSLRALFVFMTVASVFCAWFASRIHPYYRQRDEMRELVGRGVHIETEPDPTIPDWLAKLLGDEERELFVRAPIVQQLVSQRDGDAPIGDDDLQRIANWKGLRSLIVNSSNRVRDEGIAALANHPSLERLELHDSRLSDLSFEYIGSINRLTSLTLGSPRISARGIRALSQLPLLQYLGLESCTLLSSPVSPAGGLSRLEYLGLFSCRTSDAALRAVAALPRLRTIRIEGGVFSDAGVGALAECKSLEYVIVSGDSRITDAGALPLTTLPRLTRLDLQDATVTDAFIESVLGRPPAALLLVVGDNSQITSAAEDKLARLAPLVQYHVRNRTH